MDTLILSLIFYLIYIILITLVGFFTIKRIKFTYDNFNKLDKYSLFVNKLNFLWLTVICLFVIFLNTEGAYRPTLETNKPKVTNSYERNDYQENIQNEPKELTDLKSYGTNTEDWEEAKKRNEKENKIAKQEFLELEED